MNREYQISELATACQAKHHQHGQSRSISRLLIDSRQLQVPDQTLFFALQGYRQDGHDFIGQLYQKGVRAFVVSRNIELSTWTEASFLIVEDVQLALQDIAHFHRQHFEIPVVGITGSNGKTIVKEWLVYLLQERHHLVYSPKSYNSQLGVPLSIWQLHDSCDLAIFEAGISRPEEMATLAHLIQPTIGIMTNIGSAHDEGFVDRREKIREKLQLFKSCHHTIYCLDHSEIRSEIEELGLPTFSWSTTSKEADLYIQDIRIRSHTTSIEGFCNDDLHKIEIPFVDLASIENALHCLSLCILLEQHREVLGKFAQLPGINLRMEVLRGKHGTIIINDTYSADLESLGVALAQFDLHTTDHKKVVIISDFLQQSSPQLYEQVGHLLKQAKADHVIGIGKDVRQVGSYLDNQTEFSFFSSTNEAIENLRRQYPRHAVVLVKGARVFRLERIVDMLSRQKHQTVLEVDLSAMARNLKRLEGILRPQTKLMVMVKANAYGSGALEVAKFLETRNVHYLAVAFADEGVELREGGCKLPIVVLNPDEASLDALVNHQLEPEVYSMRQLHQIIQHLRYMAGNLAIHIKLETGMHRLGFVDEELDELIDLLSQCPELHVASVFSHLAASEDQSEVDFTRAQINQFDKMSQKICNSFSHPPLRHILNSQGVYYYPDAQFDMVRLGIGLYGISMPADLQLEYVHTLKTTVSQVRDLKHGSTIGYGRMGIVNQDMRVATIGIGYADGLIRKAGNGRYAVVVNGARAPIVGNVCMDMTMIDTTTIESVQEGDEVVVFGADAPIEQLAHSAQTIPYEVLTSLSTRIKRIYINE